MPLDDNKVVLFVDMLGFGALVESHPINLRNMEARQFLGGLSLEAIVSSSRDPLAMAFTSFHQSLESALSLARMSQRVTSVTFSDSAFIAMSDLTGVASVASRLAQDALSSLCPVRMGVGYGSFAAIRFRSDVGSTSSDHAVQFLGASVVRSYRAEKCGLSGIRIFLDASVIPLLAEVNNVSPRVEHLLCHECLEPGGPSDQYELNYWNCTGGREATAWRGLQDMWANAPEEAQRHYSATASAVSRMRVARDLPAIDNLRRRTLPKRR